MSEKKVKILHVYRNVTKMNDHAGHEHKHLFAIILA